jgi:hypothetical protein
MDITRKSDTEVITLIVMLGFCFAILYNFCFDIHQGYGPVNYFLVNQRKGVAFGDFAAVFHSAFTHSPYTNAWNEGAYFPFTYIVMLPFTWLKQRVAVTYYSLVALITLAVFNWLMYAKTKGQTLLHENKTMEITRNIRNVFALTLLTYPVLWNFISGNVEFYLFLFLAAFLYCYLNKKTLTSTIFLSMAIAMKLYPGVFVFLLLSEKKYKEVVLTGLLTLTISVLSLLCFKTSIHDSLAALHSNIAYLNSYFAVSIRGLTFSTSLVSFFRVMSHWIFNKDTGYTVDLKMHDIHLYFAFAVSYFSLVLIYLFKFETQTWKKVLLLTFSMIILPQVGFSYKLISVYLPLYAFANSQKNSQTSIKFNMAYCILFGLLLIPKEFQNVAGESISVMLNPGIMLTMMLLVVADRFNLNFSFISGIKKIRQLS